MAAVSEAEVLLLWRALTSYRSGRHPRCAPRGRPATSSCPLVDGCPRWRSPDDDFARALVETLDETDERRSAWPCSRLLDVLGPTTTRIG